MDSRRNDPENKHTIFVALFHELCKLEGRIVALEVRWRELEDKVDVMHECTGTYGSRLEDMEKWQEKVEDRLDQEL